MLIKDCLYLHINVPEICKMFIDHPLFQRLRRIYQVGVVKYVYPTAMHTRFEHSIGVMHLASMVINVLRKYIDITEKEEHLVMIAGLMHDIGHLCFSHLAESSELKQLFGGETHEERSVRYMKEINGDIKILLDDEVDVVANMILGFVPDDTNKPFLYEIVHNKKYDIDVDKMDYLRRDAYHTKLLEFIPNYIIECMYIDDNLHLAIKEKARNDICNMFITRKKMFYDVYHHKTVRKVEKIYVCMMTQLYQKGILNNFGLRNFDDHFMETHFNIHCSELFNQLCYRKLNHNCDSCFGFNIDICHFKEQGPFDLTNVFEFH